MRLNKLSLTAIALIFTLVATGTLPAADRAKAKIKPNAATTLLIGGMKCEGCAAGLKLDLEDLDGVARTKILFDEKLAKISFNTNHVTLAAIVKLIEKNSYKVTVKPDRAPKPAN